MRFEKIPKPHEIGERTAGDIVRDSCVRDGQTHIDITRLSIVMAQLINLSPLEIQETMVLLFDKTYRPIKD